MAKKMIRPAVCTITSASIKSIFPYLWLGISTLTVYYSVVLGYDSFQVKYDYILSGAICYIKDNDYKGIHN